MPMTVSARPLSVAHWSHRGCGADHELGVADGGGLAADVGPGSATCDHSPAPAYKSQQLLAR